MTEREVEAHLVKRVRGLGGEIFKWVSPSNRGVPDRLVFMPGGKLWAIELKAPGRKPSGLQELTLKRLRELGFQALVLDSKDAVDGFLREIV